MSYAGPSRASAAPPRGGRSTSAAGGRSSRAASSSTRRPAETSVFSDGGGETNWQEVALFGAGLALGVILGAGGALLTAPRTGAETRAAIGARAARLRRTTARRGRNAWDDLRDELRQARRALRNRKRRRHEDDTEV
jgi:hypothetical protein